MIRIRRDEGKNVLTIGIDWRLDWQIAILAQSNFRIVLFDVSRSAQTLGHSNRVGKISAKTEDLERADGTSTRCDTHWRVDVVLNSKYNAPISIANSRSNCESDFNHSWVYGESFRFLVRGSHTHTRAHTLQQSFTCGWCQQSTFSRVSAHRLCCRWCCVMQATRITMSGDSQKTKVERIFRLQTHTPRIPCVRVCVCIFLGYLNVSCLAFFGCCLKSSLLTPSLLWIN